MTNARAGPGCPVLMSATAVYEDKPISKNNIAVAVQ